MPDTATPARHGPASARQPATPPQAPPTGPRATTGAQDGLPDDLSDLKTLERERQRLWRSISALQQQLAGVDRAIALLCGRGSMPASRIPEAYRRRRRAKWGM